VDDLGTLLIAAFAIFKHVKRFEAQAFFSLAPVDLKFSRKAASKIPNKRSGLRISCLLFNKLHGSPPVKNGNHGAAQ